MYVYCLYTWEENSVNTFLHMRQKGTNKAVWEGSEILQQLQHGGRVWCFLFLCSDARQAELTLFFRPLGRRAPSLPTQAQPCLAFVFSCSVVS